MIPSQRATFEAIVLAFAAVGFFGCYHTKYVYEYADGRRIESSSPLNSGIEIRDLKPADGDGNAFTGQWNAEHLDLPRGDRNVMLTLVSDDGRRRSGTCVNAREITGQLTTGSFEMKRDSGVLKFDRANDTGGTVTLTFDPAFVAAVSEATGQTPTADQKLAT